MIRNNLRKGSYFFYLTACVAALTTSNVAHAIPGQAPTAIERSQVTVSSLAHLNHVLRNVKGATAILVAPGRYGGLSIKNLRVPSGTVIRSAIPHRPAVFDGLYLASVNGLSINNIEINPPAAGSVNGHYGALVVNSRNLKIERLRIIGPGRSISLKIDSAMMLRSSSDVTVSRSYFTNFKHGLSLLNVRNSLIEANEFESLQTDAIRGGGIHDTTIRSNVITNLSPARYDHPDGIQIWSNNQSEPGRNITIADNLIIRGRGSPVQGIFVRDTNLKLPFENLVIDGNLVVGGMYNGISVGGANGVRIVDNTVIPRTDQKSWIRMENVRRASAINNSAGTYIFRNNREEPRSRGNTTIEATDRNMARTISMWTRQKAAFASYRGPVLLRLMKTGI